MNLQEQYLLERIGWTRKDGLTLRKGTDAFDIATRLVNLGSVSRHGTLMPDYFTYFITEVGKQRLSRAKSNQRRQEAHQQKGITD